MRNGLRFAFMMALLVLLIVPAAVNSQENEKIKVLVSDSHFFLSSYAEIEGCGGLQIIVDERFPTDYKIKFWQGIFLDDFQVTYKGTIIGNGHGYYWKYKARQGACEIVKEHAAKLSTERKTGK